MRPEQIVLQPTIETERFLLRALRRDDADLIARHTSDRRIAQGTRAIPHPLPPGTAEAFIARAQSETRVEDVWAIDGSPSRLDRLVGLISLTRIEREQSEVGFWVAPELWNSGIASQAVEAMVCANPHGSRTLFAEVFQDAPGSARVLSHNGFEFLGDAEAWSLARNAKVPTWTYVHRMR